MENLLPKAILYPFIGFCLLAIYNQYDFIAQWLTDQNSPVRHEYLSGAFLVGIISSLAWAPTLVLVFWKGEIFSKMDRALAVVCAFAVPLGSVLAIILDATT